MGALYAGTYAVSNTSDTLGKSIGLSPVAHDIFRSAVTVAVNVCLGIRKDVLFARLAVQQPPGSHPGIHPETDPADTDRRSGGRHTPRQQYWPSSYVSQNRRAHTATATMSAQCTPRSVFGVFLIRDAITIFCSFTLVDWVSGTGAPSLIAQLSIPVASQVLATPVHLLALDMYSRPEPTSLVTRMVRQLSNLVPVTLVRSIRVVPALGLGVYFNKYLRSRFYE